MRDINKYNRIWYQKNKNRINKKKREDRLNNPDKYRKWNKEWYKKNRMKVLKHYGGNPPKCACCGEKTYEFLNIHHINGNGRKDRDKLKIHTMETWIIKNNYPKEFGVLCCNCNFSKGHYGYCPHHKEDGSK